MRKSSWLRPCAILLAATAFLSVLTGSAVTSNENRPFYSLGECHLWLGPIVGILAIVLVICITAVEEPSWLRRLSWAVLAGVALQAILGLQPLPQAPPVRVAHALIAQLLFPMTLALAICTSRGWQNAAKGGACAPSLWFLAKITPAVVLGQVLLGTLFRHGAIDVGPHILGAFVIAGFILALGLSVTQRPEHQSLHAAAKAFLTVAFVQLFLGLALFSMQAMEIDPSAMILVTMIHVAMGALTLAATLLLAVMIRHLVGAPQKVSRPSEQSH
jgi:heme A synthase